MKMPLAQTILAASPVLATTALSVAAGHAQMWTSVNQIPTIATMMLRAPIPSGASLVLVTKDILAMEGRAQM